MRREQGTWGFSSTTQTPAIHRLTDDSRHRCSHRPSLPPCPPCPSSRSIAKSLCLPSGVASVSTLNSGDRKEDLRVRVRAARRERQLDGSGSSLLSTSPSTACVHSLLMGAPWPCSRLRGPSTAWPAVRAQCLCADRRGKVLLTAEDAWGPRHVPGLLSSRAFAPPRVSWSQGLPTKEGTSLLSLSVPGQQGTSLRASPGLFSPERGLIFRPAGCPRARKQSPTFRALQTHLGGESEIRVRGLHVQGLWCGPNLPCVQARGEPAVPPPNPGRGPLGVHHPPLSPGWKLGTQQAAFCPALRPQGSLVGSRLGLCLF